MSRLTLDSVKNLKPKLELVEGLINMAANIQRQSVGALDSGNFINMPYQEIVHLQKLAKDLIDLGHEAAGHLCADYGIRLRITWHHPTRSFRLGVA